MAIFTFYICEISTINVTIRKHPSAFHIAEVLGAPS